MKRIISIETGVLPPPCNALKGAKARVERSHYFKVKPLVQEKWKAQEREGLRLTHDEFARTVQIDWNGKTAYASEIVAPETIARWIMEWERESKTQAR